MSSTDTNHELESLKAQLLLQAELIESLQAQNADQEHKISQIEQSNQTLSADNQTLSEDNQTLSADNQTLATDNQTLAVTNQDLTVSNQTLTELNQQLESRVERLEHLLLQFKRQTFGAKTEQMDPDQLALFEQTCTEDLSAIDQLKGEIDRLQKAHIGKAPSPAPTRQAWPEHLEREETVFLPQVDGVDDIVEDEDWVEISKEVSERLEVVPARFYVKREVYPKFKHRHTGQIVCALRPAKLIDGGSVSENVLAWVIGHKYIDHLPLHRIAQMAARDNVTLSESTLSEWVGKVGTALTPIAEALKRRLLQHRALHADETPVKQLNPKTPRKSHKGYLWVYRTADLDNVSGEVVVFDYQASRSGRHPQALLKDFSGHLMADDYAGYKALFRRTDRPIVQQACMAHARRKFHELIQNETPHPFAMTVLRDIGQLYAIEKKAKALSVTQRLAIRQDEALPVLAQLKTRLEEKQPSTPPNSNLGKAIAYTLKLWPALSVYASTGHLPIDNNPVENALRPIALGRKNWLFIGSEAAGQRQANILTLLATAKANGIEPMTWLRTTLNRLPRAQNKDLETLLPLKGWQA